MSFSSILYPLSFFNDTATATATAGGDILKTASISVLIAGGGFLLKTFLPFAIDSYKTRNTVGINKTMFLRHVIVGILFFVGAVALFVSGVGFKDWALIVVSIVLILLNLFCSIGNVYTFALKVHNMSEAAQMGLTEMEHYQQVCVPFVQEREAKKAARLAEKQRQEQEELEE